MKQFVNKCKKGPAKARPKSYMKGSPEASRRKDSDKVSKGQICHFVLFHQVAKFQEMPTPR